MGRRRTIKPITEVMNHHLQQIHSAVTIIPEEKKDHNAQAVITKSSRNTSSIYYTQAGGAPIKHTTTRPTYIMTLRPSYQPRLRHRNIQSLLMPPWAYLSRPRSGVLSTMEPTFAHQRQLCHQSISLRVRMIINEMKKGLTSMRCEMEHVHL
ncbi:hypothetical protein CPC08DRAFT_339422 [Agrocybe pediades]|nr:hypothetical protein CPC08DRAFT_339422 [Agrocybe pediades]